MNGNVRLYCVTSVGCDMINIEVANRNFKSVYSAEALIRIQALLVTKRFSILSWWE